MIKLKKLESQIKHLIISGYSRSGTTFLYNVLKSSNRFSCTQNKEVRYFIDDDFFLNNKISYTESYDELFRFSKTKLISLDSSPDYIHNKSFINFFKNRKNVFVIVINRNLDERLKSWFNYSKSRGFLSSKITYLQFLKNQQNNNDNNPPYYSVKYNTEKRNYKNLLLKHNSNRIFEIEFNSLCNNLNETLLAINNFLGINFIYDINQKKNSHKDLNWINKTPILTSFKNIIKNYVYSFKRRFKNDDDFSW